MATYGFDFADRQESLTVQAGADPPQAVVTGTTYLPSGPLSTLTLGNGLTETRAFDGRYIPAEITVPGRLDWTYTTDGEDNILQITDNLIPTASRTYGYQDIAYFLTRGDGPWGNWGWSYDKIGNRLTETRDGTTDTYAYAPNAAAGNTALLDHITLAVGGTRDYQYGPAGHLEQVTAGANQVLFTSDDEGRLARLEHPASGASTPFTYDGRSFLAKAGQPPPIFADGFESGDFSCWDAALGGSTAGTCPPPPPVPEQVRPVYSSDGLLHALGKGTTSQDLFYLAGRPVAQRDSATGQLLFLTTDHLGTPVLATNEVGLEVWSGGFEPFGEDYAGAGAAGVFLRFPGQWVDGVWEDASLGAGVFYNVHRWYMVELGRYERPDPLGLHDAPNEYHYGLANPLLHPDAMGLSVLICSRDSYLPLVGDFANHAYFWDGREGLRPDVRSCGRGQFSGREQGPLVDECKEIPGSEGSEDELMACCQRVRTVEPFFPILNDCQAALSACLEELGYPDIDPPGGRFGRPCDSCSPVIVPKTPPIPPEFIGPTPPR